ncbi:uncharacterized protein LOC111039133 [Myzus persicae]|uniref:uncharacterized protein LOC111039133 n=1 Tax=Myzus persicae TaxID=13164 RepID=UPI000B9396B8|nr:uncharacterized protein LOC111039133 [Myzus persicae]
MGIKFEGFEKCFKMSIDSTDSNSLEHLRDANDKRKQLDVKIAKGTVTRLDMMKQLTIELEILDTLLKTSNIKMRANECCAIINNVISTLTKRINNMWNTIFLLFVINDGIEPEFINITSDYKIKSNCENCSSCNTIYKSIMSNIKIISTQEDKLFNFSSSDFIKILQTTVFVDKTLMIKELFENKKIKGTAITAPRKYGKSTNLSMLKYFLEIQVDSLGKPLTKANADNPITDTSNYKLFKGLKISKEANIMNKHFGKYPVLYANFKIEKCIESYACVVEGCKEVIHKSFLLHNYLRRSSKLNLQQRTLCMLWCNNENYKNITNIDEIIIGFSSLIKCLTKHFNKPCFILIDDIDFFIVSVSKTETISKGYGCIVGFLRECLSFLNNKELIVRAFITGKYIYAINAIVPWSIEIRPFFTLHEFTDYYGLTINELEYLFKKKEFNALTVTIKEVKAYYGAYVKFDKCSEAKKEIYCMWSILNVLKCKALDNYWREFGNFFCNFSNQSIKNTIQKLLIDENLSVTLYDRTISRLHPVYPLLIAESGTACTKSLNYFLNVLLDLGYITCVSAQTPITDSFSHTDLVSFVKIPNKEVRQDIENKLSLLS